ncbi:unnamed protein product [Didymodactylos carnosus]|uniref:Uncharacterized protein n=1 Tax=Didymodactylos carnosus TaxID=1234261 RepID=A0A813QJW2_9BILA|nr:unnamed protein product [Didymodactylos carnosus]CAF0868291.1 unnamed protein product [Didymodactylos carnosus]CAF3549828.1 unnamed protein product [Didymodactylos carnosus]CAF3653108.1 unnamed protein product [Didymodactylos carnosus]
MISQRMIVVSLLLIVFTLILQTINGQPILAVDDAVVSFDPEREQRSLTENNGALRVKRDDTNNNNILSLLSPLNSLSLNDVVDSDVHNLIQSHENKPSNFFKSTGSSRQLRLNKKLRNGGVFVDNRLKRFRMLDPEEFHEMLQSMHLSHPEQSKAMNGVDTIGMQLENYWSRK